MTQCAPPPQPNARHCRWQAHSCVEKAGMISLVKIRELNLDENYSLRGDTLQAAIDADRRKGLIPFYVGTCVLVHVHNTVVANNSPCKRHTA